MPALFGELTVAENLALRLESGGLWRMINWRERRRRTSALLARVGATTLSPDARVADLGMAQQQLVEIASAIGSRARVIIFDEPTASLGSDETEHLFKVIEYLKTPPTRDELARLFQRAAMAPREGLRMREAGAKALVERNADDDAILDAMAADPILIERPLVETGKGVRLARPADKVDEIL